jgi:fatty acid desaturase
MLLTARQRGILSAREQRLALVESGLMAAGWVVLGFAVGWPAFLFAVVLPLLVANSIVMGFILTNHSLSPHTAVNDPLVNSLSVTAPRSVEWLTLRFGYHVEHHLFPWMSSRHAPLLRHMIRARWPERYQSMSLWHALAALHRTGRVYVEPTTLLDVRAGKRWRAITPRAGEAEQPAAPLSGALGETPGRHGDGAAPPLSVAALSET